MPRVPETTSRFNPDDGHRGISRASYENSINRVRAGKPFELTWKDKIYLRRMRRHQSQAQISRELGISARTISTALNAAARRFEVSDIAELLALDEVQRQLNAED